MTVNEVREIIRKDGFKHYKTCRCGGVLTEKYQLNPVWRINILPNKQTFFIIRNANAIVGKSIERFNEVYNEYKTQIFEVI